MILAVGVVLLDYASQAAINPCEALMSDMMAGQVGTLRGQSYANDYLSPIRPRCPRRPVSASTAGCSALARASVISLQVWLTSEGDRVPVQNQNVYFDLFFWWSSVLGSISSILAAITQRRGTAMLSPHSASLIPTSCS